MSRMKWTRDQKKVIDLRNRNILVSAAAGSGKTAVLVERIIGMITDEKHPVDIDRLLIVTFTNAAAGEMRERIRTAVEKKLMQQPSNSHLQKQISLIHNAQITTIHSFCLWVIRNYFNQIDLDPGFRIGDEAELRLLKSDVLAGVLEECYEEGRAEFLDFIESYAYGKSDSGIEDIILRLYEFSISYPWPKKWLEENLEAFAFETKEEFLDRPWMKQLIFMLRQTIEDCLQENKRAQAIAEEGNGPYMYLDALLEDQKVLESLNSCAAYDEYYEQLKGISWKRLSAKKDETVDPEKRELVKALRGSIKDHIQGLCKQYFYQSLAESMEDMKRVRPAMEVVTWLTMKFSQAFAKKKEEKNIVDFSDFEHFALDILVKDNKPSPIAIELSQSFDEILIDEYQDSNYVQETLLNSISREKFGEPNLFMVGDVKQSIYKFRLARPELFLWKYQEYSVEESKYQRIDLHKNFRSRVEVINSINHIFERIMRPALGGIPYDKDAALYPGAEFGEDGTCPKGGPCEILLLDKKEMDFFESSPKEMEAEVIVKRMEELTESGYCIWDKDHYRRAGYGDMVILLRTMSGWADEFVQILNGRGIPAYADTQTGYFSAIEVKTILNYLLIIDNGLQDIPLTAVLRSPIGNFTDEELGKIRAACHEKGMYESLKAYCELEEREEIITDKIDGFFKTLFYFRSKASYTGVYELLVELYEKTDYYNIVSVMPSGEGRKANLDMLLQKAADFQKTSYHGLFHFNRYIEKLHQYDIDFGEAGIDGKEGVRIMSIHKSKGLEFPIVFLAGMGKSFNQQDARSRLILHPDMGAGPDYIDYEKRMKTPTLLKKVMQKKISQENLGEELRVLYVALTRGREKLILTGQVKDLDKKMKSWQEKKVQSFSDLSGAGNYLDWVMPCALCGGKLFQVRPIDTGELTFHEISRHISKEQMKQELLHWDSEKHLSNEDKKEMEEIFRFSYAFQKEEQIKSKISISELKHKEYEEEWEDVERWYPQEDKTAYIPAFREEKEEIRGTKRGNVYHKIMEKLPFEGEYQEDKLRLEAEKLVQEGQISQEDWEAVNPRQLLWFFRSSLSKRMAAARAQGRLFREQPFVLGIEASRIYEDMEESEETVLVQGIIDAYFEEEGEIVLVDYKTDQVKAPEELIERYKTQLDYYEEALHQITGKTVKEMIIYSFALGKPVLIGK